MRDPVILRSTLRKALAMRPRETMSEVSLKLTIERLLGLTPGALSVPDFQTALEWNHARNFCEYNYDDEAESNYWELTREGKTKEGVK
jgi:hypothetical protein